MIVEDTIETIVMDHYSLLKYLKFECVDDAHIVTLIDERGYEIVRGYGNSRIDAINDMHGTLI